MTDHDLSSAERARARKRDRKASAPERAGMRTGLLKQFKLQDDITLRRAAEAAARLREREQAATDRALRAGRKLRPTPSAEA